MHLTSGIQVGGRVASSSALVLLTLIAGCNSALPARHAGREEEASHRPDAAGKDRGELSATRDGPRDVTAVTDAPGDSVVDARNGASGDGPERAKDSAGDHPVPEPSAVPDDCREGSGEGLVGGPLIGHVSDSAARLWIQTTAPACVRVAYGTSEDLVTAKRSPSVKTTIPGDRIAVVNLTDLPAGTRHHYQVLVGDRAVPDGVGSFQTASTPGRPGVVTFAFGGCLDHPGVKDLPMDIGKVLTARPPDFFLWLGDNHYGDYKYARDFPRAYQYLRQHATWRSFHATVPSYATWDDHDFWGDQATGSSLSPMQLAWTTDVFRRYWANPAYAVKGTTGVWFSFRHGDVEVFMLDGRTHRNRQTGVMLGAEQTAWLRRGLKASTAAVKVIGHGSQWHGCHPHPQGDSWDAFTKERDALYRFIQDEGITGVLLVSSDRHRSEINVWKGAGARYPLYEFSSSALHSVFKRECARPCTGGYDNRWCFDARFNVQYMAVDTRGGEARLTMTAYDDTGKLLKTFPLTGRDIGIP